MPKALKAPFPGSNARIKSTHKRLESRHARTERHAVIKTSLKESGSVYFVVLGIFSTNRLAVREERFCSGDRELDVAARDGLPPGGLTTCKGRASYLIADGPG
ncbi:hypothetical protein EVAR_103608_1 [Eumeta japonica]|uniref:Uncharacterized protein n=1 Tax=Eumeta variegata TaxID=151549 RepID=A0A4C1Z4K1_EUMVA|nr:hypothetical protein EVAR_103608_1 [Eumeta japonica]